MKCQVTDGKPVSLAPITGLINRSKWPLSFRLSSFFSFGHRVFSCVDNTRNNVARCVWRKAGTEVFLEIVFFLSVKRFRAIASRHFRSTWTPCPVWVTSFLTTPWLKAADREHVGHDPTFSFFFFNFCPNFGFGYSAKDKTKRKEKKRKSCRDRGLSSLRSGLFSCRSLPSSFLAKKKK